MDDLDLDTGNPGQSDSWESALEVSITEHLEAPPAEETPAEERRRGNPYKGPDGKFTSPDKAVKVEPAEPVEPETPAEPPKPIWKPSSWKSEELNGWETIPDHIRQAVERREREITQGLESSARERQFARQVQEAAGPYMQQLQSIGVNPVDAYREALQAVSLLSSPDPNVRASMLQRMAQRWNVPLGGEQPQQQFQADPQYAATQAELAQLRNSLAQMQQAQKQREDDALRQTVESFAQSKPHFETLRPVMADLFQRGEAQTLEEAYDKAFNSVKTLFAAQEQQRQEEAAKKAAEARKAAAVNVQSRPAPAQTAPKAKSWEEGLKNAFDSLSA